jgi:nitroreductase
MKEFLQTRRSTKVKMMVEPGASQDELNDILEIAARVPDHGKLSPFYFIVFQGEARKEFGKHLARIWKNDHPDATQYFLNNEKNRFMMAPLVVAVISRIRDAKIPAWEQILTAGACCHNLCLAANAHGYGTNWLTQWYYNHPEVRNILDLEDGRDNVAGFIYIGTQTEKQDDRERPDIKLLTNNFGEELNKKGHEYNKDGMTKPEDGFSI